MAGSGLATVMFTDLVGSTRMRDRLGDDVADEIGVEHDRIIGDALSSTGGRLVKNLGDGALAVFDSSVDAVVAGQRIQEGVALYNREADEDRRIGVRIGINAGEIVTDNGDVIGLPVAVASRVCDKAEGGQILITDTVRSLIGRRARFPYASVGAHSLKGVEGPVELWSIEEAVAPASPATHAQVPFPQFLTRGMPRNLVGRQDQFAQLNTAYADATTTVELVAVIGEPGIGKTSLTSTWCRGAADGGATVVAGRCTPDAVLPYQPFVEIARAILGARPELLREIGPAAGNIAQLVPGIDVPVGIPVPIQTDPDTTRYLMAEAFAALLDPGEDESSAVVVLDDLHWADEHSIAVLAHIVRREELSALIIGTYRDTDLVQSHPLPRLLADLRRERRVVRIAIPRLSEDEVDEMISGHFGTSTAPAIVESIAAETQGNPFFVEEITTHLQDEGAIDNAGEWVSEIPIEEYGVPEGIRDVVGRRLGHLGENAVATLEVAAVIGPSFSIDVAGSLADLSERDIDRVVDIAMGARMITEGDSADSFSFTHALLRQTLYDDLPTRRRTRLHRSVAEALEERNAPAPVLLSHWLKAERPTKALEAAIRSADESERAFAGTDIALYLELALDLWDDSDHPEEATGGTRVELVCRLASALADFSRQYDEALDLVNAELATHVTDDDSRALLYRELSLAYSRKGIATLSSEALREALDLSRNTGRADIRLKVLGSYSGNLMMNDQSEEAIKAAREAIAIAADLDAEMQRYAPFSMLATALAQLGELEEALEYFDVALDINQASGDLTGQLIVYANKGEMLWVNGRMADALEFTEDAIAKVSELGVPPWLGVLHGNALLMLFDLGRWDDAARHLNDYQYDEADHTHLHLAVCRMRIAAERGEREAVETALQQASMHDLSEVYAEFQGRYWDSYVSDLRWQCQLQEAFDAATSSLDILGGRNDWMHATRLTALGIEVAADGVEAGVADQGWLNAASDWLDRFSVYHPTISFAAQFKATASADYARATGNNDAELWRTAVDAWEDHPYYRAKAKWRLAQSLAETDPSDPEITELLDQAHLAAEDLGARPLLYAIESTRENPSQ